MAIGILEAEAGRRGAGLRHRPGSHRPTANDAENTPQAAHCDDYWTRRFDDYPDVRDNVGGGSAAAGGTRSRVSVHGLCVTSAVRSCGGDSSSPTTTTIHNFSTSFRLLLFLVLLLPVKLSSFVVAPHHHQSVNFIVVAPALSSLSRPPPLLPGLVLRKIIEMSTMAKVVLHKITTACVRSKWFATMSSPFSVPVVYFCKTNATERSHHERGVGSRDSELSRNKLEKVYTYIMRLLQQQQHQQRQKKHPSKITRGLHRRRRRPRANKVIVPRCSDAPQCCWRRARLYTSHSDCRLRIIRLVDAAATATAAMRLYRVCCCCASSLPPLLVSLQLTIAPRGTGDNPALLPRQVCSRQHKLRSSRRAAAAARSREFGRNAIKTSRGEKRLRSSPPATDQQPAPKLSRPYAATNTTAHTQINTEMMNNQSSGTTQIGAAESTAIQGSVPAQWLIEFEQRILARFDNRFDEVSGRMSRLEEAQARQEATLTHELAEAADFRAACSREMMAFQRELRGEIEVACARIVSTTAVTGPREANETEEDSCEVRFDGLPSGVDPSSTETVKKILQAMGLARFEMHIARVREWINRNPRSTDQSSSRQIVAQLSSPFIRDEVIGCVTCATRPHYVADFRSRG
ncbi:unnamed protein product [Trichogramma brassicae]|uniref:Uncharacterized protein n=1 Tax=Trichogramma brassicae TaxID=86971 RepID=A0A6H5IAI0_9HYME|nr:unnamed protein product [Trichogramma brassicae]